MTQGLRSLRRRTVSPDAGRPRGAKGSRLGRRIGRGILWAAIALVFLRGLGAILSDPSPTTASSAPATGAAVTRADDEARAFAVAFTRAYLTFNPRRPDAHRRSVARYLAHDLSDQATALASPRSPGAAVAQATVARAVSLGGARVLFTVAAFLKDGRTVYLAVPVARDDDGELTVFDLPAVAPPPAVGDTAADAGTPLSGADARSVGDLIGRFLRAYLSGEDEAALAYFLAPGAHVVPMPPGLRVLAVDELTAVRSAPNAQPRARTVLATVRLREEASHIVYRLRYRVTVIRRDRWYVVTIAGGPQG